MRPKSGIWFISALSVLLGWMIYVLFRSSDIAALHWMHSIGADGWIQHIRSLVPGSGLSIPSWIIYSLPNGLWAFAYALIISSLWIRHTSRIKWIWLSTIPTLVLGFELLQYPKILPGTFSMEDLLSGTAGILLGIFIGIKLQKSKKNEKALA